MARESTVHRWISQSTDIILPTRHGSNIFSSKSSISPGPKTLFFGVPLSVMCAQWQAGKHVTISSLGGKWALICSVCDSRGRDTPTPADSEAQLRGTWWALAWKPSFWHTSVHPSAFLLRWWVRCLHVCPSREIYNHGEGKETVLWVFTSFTAPGTVSHNKNSL